MNQYALLFGPLWPAAAKVEQSRDRHADCKFDITPQWGILTTSQNRGDFRYNCQQLLQFIRRHEGYTVAGLARLQGKYSSTITPQMQALFRAGYIRKVVGAETKHYVWYLTEKGRKYHE